MQDLCEVFVYSHLSSFDSESSVQQTEFPLFDANIPKVLLDTDKHANTGNLTAVPKYGDSFFHQEENSGLISRVSHVRTTRDMNKLTSRSFILMITQKCLNAPLPAREI